MASRRPSPVRSRSVLRSAARVVLVVALGTTTLAGCQSAPKPKPNPIAASVRLAPLLEAWERAKREDGGCEQRRPEDTPLVDCDRIAVEVARLAVEFPRDPEVLLAHAAIEFDNGRYGEALHSLDVLRSVEPIHADAAVLRARIAIEDGNFRFAKRLLEEQRELTPDHAGLWEMLASLAYLAGDHAESERHLDVAGRLGAPPWRIEYHRGLVAEARNQFDRAALAYEACLDGNPDFAPARSRLRALRVLHGSPTPR